MLNRLKIIELTGVPNPRNSPWHSAIAEAIPPLFLKLETTASVFLLKFTNYSVRFLYHFFVRIVVIDVG
jgi:hypothetical protein